MIDLSYTDFRVDWETKLFLQTATNEMGFPHIISARIRVGHIPALLENLRQHGILITDYEDVTNLVKLVGSGCVGTIETKDNQLWLAYKDEAVPLAIFDRCAEHFKIQDEASVELSYYYIKDGNVNRTDMELSDERLATVYPELYPDIDVVDLANQYRSSNESLLFLTGIPGVGKTSFIRYLLKTIIKNKMEANATTWEDGLPARNYAGQLTVAYAKDMEVMLSSQFWSSLVSRNYTLIIFDDLDFALGERKPGEDSFVSNLLSFSDGVFGNKSRIIITTNLEVTDIDKALLRPGRCFDFLVLNALTAKEAIELWTGTLGMDKDLIDPAWLKVPTVTQAALMSQYLRIKTNNRERTYIKNGPRVYSVEQKIAEMLKNKKAGF